MKLKKDFFEKLLIYIFPIIIVIDIINRYMINNYILYILNNIMYVGYFIVILVFLFSKNKKRKSEKRGNVHINCIKNDRINAIFTLYNFLMYQKKKDGEDILFFDDTSAYNNAIYFIDT